jgi:hypothetical protein
MSEDHMVSCRADLPTRPTVFHRDDGFFYVINTYEDEGFVELAEHAALNPGTARIEDLAGNVLWRRQ